MTTISKMRGLALAGLVLLSGAASGCIIESSSGGCPAGTPAFFFRWDLVDAVTNARLTCAQVGAVDLDIVAGPMAEAFNCEDYNGTTSELPAGPGVYPVTVQLYDINNQLITEVGPDNFTAVDCRVTDIGTVVFRL